MGRKSASSAEEQPTFPGGAMGQEPPTQPAEGAVDAGIEAQPGALGQGQSQASSATEQWVLLGGSFLALGNRAGGDGALPQKGVTILATKPARDGVPAVPRFVPGVPLRGM